MLNRVSVAALSMVASAWLAAPAAHAVDLPAGDWKLGLSGFASGYLQHGFCDHAATSVAGGFACTTGISGQVGNSTLGRIGAGYIFADFFPQIQYTTPQLGGFQLQASIIQGFDAVPMADVNGVKLIEHPLPGLMAKANFDWQGLLAGHTWVSGWLQSSSSTTPQFAGEQRITSSALDPGGRLAFQGLTAV